MKPRITLLAIILVFSGWFYFHQRQAELMTSHSGKARRATSDFVSKNISTQEPNLEPKAQAQSEVAGAQRRELSRAEIENRFHKIGDRILMVMPSKRDLQGLPDSQIHHTPEALIRVGEHFADLASLVTQNPHLAAKAMEFYHSCAMKESNPNSVRALCYGNYQRVVTRSGDHRNFPGEDQLPEAVRALAQSAKF